MFRGKVGGSVFRGNVGGSLKVNVRFTQQRNGRGNVGVSVEFNAQEIRGESATNFHSTALLTFTQQDDEFHAKRLEQRFNEAEEEEEPEEVVNLGDSQVGGSLDDYVPPEDAYVHNLLTSRCKRERAREKREKARERE